ncbi:gamma carbonic anhydrase [Rubeoparvulum massiliense]|uniref:gamma carbonic anhydrase n=1 Tax=Rubeoparvulum massiliense TaxID=1631346 RepID=UPI00065DFF86|nr:gamma carbonic anhydrase family protein [Rubeoparvulum massiliense]
MTRESKQQQPFILPFQGITPNIHPTAFIAHGVVISGDVSIEELSSIWYGTSIRGDIAPTRIGKRVNIQDNSTLHQSPHQPLIIADDVTIGHNAILHSCQIDEGALIGMGAIIMDGAKIGKGAMVAAGSLVPPRMEVPPQTLVMGSPARVIRQLTAQDLQELERIRTSYAEKGQYYKQMEEEYFTTHSQG